MDSNNILPDQIENNYVDDYERIDDDDPNCDVRYIAPMTKGL